MTVKEYNKIYSEVGACKIVVNKLDEILQDGDIARLQSLVAYNFTKIVSEALDIYLIHAKTQINPCFIEDAPKGGMSSATKHRIFKTYISEKDEILVVDPKSEFINLGRKA